MHLREVRIKMGRRLLAELIEWKKTSISSLADYYEIRPSEALDLMSEALAEDERLGRAKHKH